MIANQTELLDIAQVVEQGLSLTPKRLPSWLFYDETGDKIFQRIMKMPEYYLTNCEYESLQRNKEDLRIELTQSGSSFKLIEFGAGDGIKTEILLKHFTDHSTAFTYYPVDVSEAVLSQLTTRLNESLPSLSIKQLNHRYEEAISIFTSDFDSPKVFLFLGANIGNFTIPDAIHFITKISSAMSTGDHLLVGFDLKKNPRIIKAAYDDPHGITRDFNLNLLVRLNRELGANFNLEYFEHYPFYDPESGTTKSYLISLKDQEVLFSACDKLVRFKQWEPIHTEISQKYDLTMIKRLASEAGLTIKHHYFDSKQFFCDVLFTK